MSSRKTSSKSTSVEDRIRSLTAGHPVVVFSKSYCPYCKRAKALLKDLGARFHVVELDTAGDGRKVQQGLVNITGHRTVPNIWIGGTFVGGCDDVIGLNDDGLLVDKLRAAKALA